jgi:uncharacterized membrane protein YbhN (UPF0104 family)
MTTSASPPAHPEATELPIWRKLLPLLVGAVLVGYVLLRIDFGAFVKALASTHYVAFFLFTVAFVGALLVADGSATAAVYRRLVAPVRTRDFMVIRGASYLLSLINHHVGQGWLTYFVARAYRAPLWRVAGATLFVYVTTFGCLFVLVAAALPYNHRQIPWLLPTVGALAVAAALYAAVIGVGVDALRRREATAPLFEAGIKGHLIALVQRMPHVLVQFLGTWLPLRFFGVNVPLTDALALVPVIMLVQTLPITPQGLGTRDVVAVELLSRYSEGPADQGAAAVAAATLTWACSLTLVQLLISPVLMRRARRLLEGVRG